MQITYHKIIILAVVSCAVTCVDASQKRASFFSHGPSAAAYGRGETAVASGNDVALLYYNPATLATISQTALGAAHYPLLDGTRYDFLGIAVPGRIWSVGAFAGNLCSGDVYIRKNIDSDPGVINVNQWLYGLTVARELRVPFRVAVGLTAKCFSQDMYGYTASGWGIDAGTYKSWEGPMVAGLRTRMSGGLSIMNLVSPRITLHSDEETYPKTYRAGMSWAVPVKQRFDSKDYLSVMVDTVYEEVMPDCNAGVEYRLMDRYCFRMGAHGDMVTAGFGFRTTCFSVDYAMDYGRLVVLSKMGVNFYFGAIKRASSTSQVLMAEAKRVFAEDAALKESRRREAQALFVLGREEYHRKNYLRSTEIFRKVMLQYPEYGSSSDYYEDVQRIMDRDARGDLDGDFEVLAYAEGFKAYQDRKYAEAIREWEKVLMLDPERNEVRDYLEKAKKLQLDERLRAQEVAFESSVQQILASGISAYDAKDMIGAIKLMEQVIASCRDKNTLFAADRSRTAKEYLKRSLQALSSNIRVRPRRNNKGSADQVVQEIDEKGSDDRYREGLVLYAQGKTSEAVRVWEIAVRLNPGHEKALKALDRVHNEQ